jgi:MurNAc alpha-1-phosphate uridylyltransferase
VTHDHPAALVLAAGRGSRLAPLTAELPKALCPVGGTALVDLAIDRCVAVRWGQPPEVSPDPADVARDPLDVVVNTHHHAELLHRHLAARGANGEVPLSAGPDGWRHGGGNGLVRLWWSWERQEALGTAGAIGRLRPWLDGRGLLVVNADAWTDAPLGPLVEGWRGDSVRVLVANGEFGPRASVAGSLLPWSEIAGLEPEPSGLFEMVWDRHHRAGTLEVVSVPARFIDCGTPGDYLRANLAATGGSPSVGTGARVLGTVNRSVVWPGAIVDASEHLVDAIRTTAGQTVLVRRRGRSQR